MRATGGQQKDVAGPLRHQTEVTLNKCPLLKNKMALYSAR